VTTAAHVTYQRRDMAAGKDVNSVRSISIVGRYEPPKMLQAMRLHNVYQPHHHFWYMRQTVQISDCSSILTSSKCGFAEPALTCSHVQWLASVRKYLRLLPSIWKVCDARYKVQCGRRNCCFLCRAMDTHI